MVIADKALRRDRLIENRVVFTGQPYKRTGKQLLDLDVRTEGVVGTDRQINATFAQGFVIGKALRHHPQGGFGHFLRHLFAQCAAVNAKEHVIGANAERALQLAQVTVLTLGENAMSQFDHAAHLLLQLQCSRCGHKPAPGAHQDGVVQGLTNARQGAAHGRCAEVHAPGSAHH